MGNFTKVRWPAQIAHLVWLWARNSETCTGFESRPGGMFIIGVVYIPVVLQTVQRPGVSSVVYGT